MMKNEMKSESESDVTAAKPCQTYKAHLDNEDSKINLWA